MHTCNLPGTALGTVLLTPSSSTDRFRNLSKVTHQGVAELQPGSESVLRAAALCITRWSPRTTWRNTPAATEPELKPGESYATLPHYRHATCLEMRNRSETCHPYNMYYANQTLFKHRWSTFSRIQVNTDIKCPHKMSEHMMMI